MIFLQSHSASPTFMNTTSSLQWSTWMNAGTKIQTDSNHSNCGVEVKKRWCRHCDEADQHRPWCISDPSMLKHHTKCVSMRIRISEIHPTQCRLHGCPALASTGKEDLDIGNGYTENIDSCGKLNRNASPIVDFTYLVVLVVFVVLVVSCFVIFVKLVNETTSIVMSILRLEGR